jgi:hypothetical protein
MNPGCDANVAYGRRHAGVVTSATPERGLPTTYEVLVRGELSDDLIADLGGRRFEPSRGKTLILVDVIDQSHLHGVLAWFQDHNVEIERVNPA